MEFGDTCDPHLVIHDCAVVVAAVTEEMAKYIIGRRYHGKLGDGIGCRGVVACVASAALGLAGAEHVMYAVGYITTMGFVPGILEGLFRACIAFPLHVGTVSLICYFGRGLFCSTVNFSNVFSFLLLFAFNELI